MSESGNEVDVRQETQTGEALPSHIFFLNPCIRPFMLNGKKNLENAVPSNMGLTLGLLCIMLCPLLILAAGLRQYALASELNQMGKSTQGEIIGRRHDAMNGRTFGAKYFVSYRFAVPGTADFYTNEQLVSKASFDHLVEGALVQVSYLPSNPQVSAIATPDLQSSGNASAYMLVVIGLVGLLITAVFLAPRLIHLLQERQLYRRGQILLGHTMSCHRFATETSISLNPNEFGSALKSNFYIELSYRFRTPEGKLIRAVERRKRNDLRQQALPSFGIPIVVLYLDDTHYVIL